MRKRTIVTIAGVAVGALVLGGAGYAVATGDDDDDRPISADVLERASAAALAHVGGGRVTDTEEGDEDSYYEVEITLDDGTQVDVQLDEDFRVVSTEPDREDAGVED